MDESLTLAIKILSRIELQNISIRSALLSATEQQRIKNRRVVNEAKLLVRNVLSRKNFIDRLLDLALTPSSLIHCTPNTQAFLRIFVFKTKFSAGDIEEATNLIKSGRSILGWKRLLPVEEAVGKILSISRKQVLSGLNSYRQTSFQYYYPEWFIKYCFSLIGRRETLRLLNYPAQQPTYLRVNTLKSGEEEILKTLSKFDVTMDKVKDIPYLYRIVHSGKTLTELKSELKGLISFQSKTACFAALLGETKSGYLVYEMGVRPIAKTLYLAQLLNNNGRIVSMDSSTSKIQRLKLEAMETGVKNMEPLLIDGNSYPTLKEEADLVLVSPECSDTGLFWRNPQLKWSIDFKKVEDAATNQWSILSKSKDYVKPGGSLVYWTRSIMAEEDELIIERFLKIYPEFSLAESQPHFGVPAFRGQIECQRLYPHMHAVDGSFFARLKRVESD